MNKQLECILLVDDNDSDNFLHRRVIERSGVSKKVEIAMNGREALDLLTAGEHDAVNGSKFQQPELILLDINMPVMDGWEFLDNYQALEKYPTWNVAIVILTTSINPADKIKTEQRLGLNSFHYKPLTPDLLRRIIETHFPGYL